MQDIHIEIKPNSTGVMELFVDGDFICDFDRKYDARYNTVRGETHIKISMGKPPISGDRVFI